MDHAGWQAVHTHVQEVTSRLEALLCDSATKSLIHKPQTSDSPLVMFTTH